MVNFAGMEFIFRFLPVFLIIYYLVPKRFRDTVLLFGSIVFYAVGELFFIPVLLVATGLNFWLGKRKKKKNLMIAAIVIDVLILVVFKVLGVWVSSDLLPLGISFYIFKMISYQADLYRGDIAPNPTFKDAALYFCMFPQVISGPIMRYEEGEFGFERDYSLEQVEDGLKYFIIGFGMKVLLADRLAIFWNDMQMIGFASISTPLAWLGALAYSLRLYFDFWGYSLMAAGLGVMLGFPFIRNFNHPYSAGSISDFYRRWHMTLGSWFRDYVYIPMGGSRVGKVRIVLNLLLVWLLTGIWHGSGVNYVIWGIILGILVVSEKLFTGKYLAKIPVLGNLYVIFLIPLTWVVFAINDLKQLGIYFSRLFPFLGEVGGYVNRSDFVNYLQNYGVLLAAGVLLCIPGVGKLYEKYKKNIAVIILLVVLFWYGVYFLVSQDGNPFMYLKF